LLLNNSNLDIQPYAIGAEDTIERMRINRRSIGANATLSTSPEYDSFNVIIRSAFSVIESKDAPKPDVVKIDVEGHECEVISGFEHHLQKVRSLYIEVHNEYGVQLEDIAGQIKDAGFEIPEVFEIGDDTVIIYACQR
jgi:FkbM family methyltransferase